MKKLFIALIAVAGFFPTLKAAQQPVIPQPASYTMTQGEFEVPSYWKVKTSLPEATAKKILGVLKHSFVLTGTDANLILKNNPEIGEEGYNLSVTPDKVTIEASGEKGFYYGLQSLYQLSGATNRAKSIACLEIEDYPRFGYRSFMLDPVRYFIPKEEVLKLIDLISALKFNTLHLHLTDDNGWRMEIKQYPKLTEVGAWRVDRPEIFPGRMNAVSAEEETPVGGFYTQDDLREIVAYAADRYVNVVPEIEMPAHAAAAIAAYPELACPVVDKFVGVFPGIGGPDASIIMCGGNDEVFEFYKNVLDEVMEVFPSQYIHLGGDEADKTIWQQCPKCQQRIKDLNLKDNEELQGYFMDTINSYIRSKGRTAMGWDEVTIGKPKEDIIILGWRGMGNAAADYAKETGRKFVMTPSKLLYLLRYQGPQWFEPYTYFGNNTLQDVYMYEPVQPNWTQEQRDLLMGIQGSLWTEFCESPEDVEYLVFPRLLAVADGAWRQEGSTDWPGFIAALDNYLPELEDRGIIYSNSMYNIQHTAQPKNDGVEVTLVNERPDTEIKYYLRGNENNLQTYSKPVVIKGDGGLVAQTYLNGKPQGHPLVLNINGNKATGKSVKSNNCNNDLEYVLTNGVRGSNRISDFEWAGWHNREAEFTVDLGEVMPLNSVNLGGIAFSHICVALPEEVEIYGSEDGDDYELLQTVETPEELIFAKESTHHEYIADNLDKKARYIKVKAKNPGKVPEGFAREGAPTWLYFDEISVN